VGLVDEDIWYSALAGLDLQVILNSVSIFGFIELYNFGGSLRVFFGKKILSLPGIGAPRFREHYDLVTINYVFNEVLNRGRHWLIRTLTGS